MISIFLVFVYKPISMYPVKEVHLSLWLCGHCTSVLQPSYIEKISTGKLGKLHQSNIPCKGSKKQLQI